MRSRRTTKGIQVGASLALFALSLALSLQAEAKQAAPQDAAPLPCAVLGKFQGEVQILDATRSNVIDAAKNAGIPCGGWVSTGNGWAELKHRDGYKIHLGSKTFVELPENNPDGKYSGDHIVVYKGQAFAWAGNGATEFRFVTANGRARLPQGSAIMVFDEASEETQLIALEKWASLENRFESSRKMRVKAGESTALNLKLLRVVPNLPKAVSVASLRAKMGDLHLDERDRTDALEYARRRNERTLASELVRADSDDDYRPEKGGSKAEHQKEAKKKRSPSSHHKTTYARHTSAKEDAALHTHWVNRMVAGQQEGERILFPDKFYGRPQQVKVDVQADNRLRHPSAYKQDEDERKRLLEELSKIRED